MRLTHFFIERPRFATVLSAFVTLLGLGALAILPVAQYPEIVPPTVQITTVYPGASADTVARTVATPLEQQINGVENMLYLSSQSTGDGRLTITVTFRIGTDLNVAQMLTQNRVQDALPRLPEDVQRLGVQVRKATPSILLAIHLYSPDKSRDNLYLSNSGTIFSGLPSLYNHEIPGVTANTVLADLRARLSVIKDARVLTIPPPPVQGLGSAGGFKMMLEDRGGLGSEALVRAANDLVAAANKDPHFAGAFTLFNTGSPSVYADVDRVKAQKVGVTPTDVFSTLQVYLGSQYVNDFNLLGRTYEVVVQADGQYRRNQPDITRLRVRNTSGEMVPIGTVAQLKDNTIPYRVRRYDLFPAAEVQGAAAPGVASGTALLRMEALAHQVLPQGIGFEWTDLSFQEQQHGTPTLVVFCAAALFVFL